MLGGQRRFHIGAGNHVGQLGREGDHLVMLLRRGEAHLGKADGEEDFLRPADGFNVRARRGGQDHGGVFKQVVLGVGEAAALPPRHGMAADKYGLLPCKSGVQSAAHEALHSAAVDHQGTGLESINMVQRPVHRVLGIQRHQHDVAVRQVFVRQFPVDSPHHFGL